MANEHVSPIFRDVLNSFSDAPKNQPALNSQEDYILTFIYWLQRQYNYHPEDGTYSHKLDKVTPEEDIQFLNAAQCLDLFRKQDILAFTELPIPSASRALDLAEEALQQSAIAARNNVVLMGGYKKITALLERTGRSPLLDGIREIYLETMTQLNQK